MSFITQLLSLSEEKMVNLRKRQRSLRDTPEQSTSKRRKIEKSADVVASTAKTRIKAEQKSSRQPFVKLENVLLGGKKGYLSGKKNSPKKIDASPAKVKVEDEKHHSTSQESDEEDDDDGMCEFERRRLQNLKDNADFLSKMGILEAKTNLANTLDPIKPRPTYRGLKERPEPKPTAPVRKSLRIQRIDPLGNQLPDPPPQPLQDYESLHERKPTGPLEMRECVRNSEDSDKHDAFLTSLSKLAKEKVSLKHNMADDTSRYVKSLSGMQITEDRVVKMVPQRIFSVAVHPANDRLLTCVGDKWGRVALWDVGSEHGQDGVYCYEPHSRPVSCVVFHPQYHNKLYSSSYDGTIRCMSLEKAVFDEVYSTPEENDNRLSALDFLSPDSLITSQGDGTVGIVDLRSDKKSAEHTYLTHYRYLKCVSVHPTQKHYFLTSSNDGTVRLWDLRKMSKKPNSLQELPHSKSVDSAYFSPITGKHILTTSIDDKIRVFDSSELSTKISLASSVRHDNHTGRWLSNFKATWHPQREDIFVVGSMARPRQIEMYSDKAERLRIFQNADHLNSVCSLNALHPTRNILVGGNSSGRTHIFMD